MIIHHCLCIYIFLVFLLLLFHLFSQLVSLRKINFLVKELPQKEDLVSCVSIKALAVLQQSVKRNINYQLIVLPTHTESLGSLFVYFCLKFQALIMNPE